MNRNSVRRRPQPSAPATTAGLGFRDAAEIREDFDAGSVARATFALRGLALSGALRQQRGGVLLGVREGGGRGGADSDEGSVVLALASMITRSPVAHVAQ